MPTYCVELTKVIVVTMETETEAEAIEVAISESIDTGFDGAWDRAEASAKIL